MSGVTIGPGGQRLGRNLDDMEAGSTDELPEYKASQPGLPNYAQTWESTPPAAAASEQMLSVEEYERTTRAPRNGEAIEMTEQRGPTPSYIPPALSRAVSYISNIGNDQAPAVSSVEAPAAIPLPSSRPASIAASASRPTSLAAPPVALSRASSLRSSSGLRLAPKS